MLFTWDVYTLACEQYLQNCVIGSGVLSFTTAGCYGEGSFRVPSGSYCYYDCGASFFHDYSYTTGGCWAYGGTVSDLTCVCWCASTYSGCASAYFRAIYVSTCKKGYAVSVYDSENQVQDRWFIFNKSRGLHYYMPVSYP